MTHNQGDRSKKRWVEEEGDDLLAAEVDIEDSLPVRDRDRGGDQPMKVARIDRRHQR